MDTKDSRPMAAAEEPTCSRLREKFDTLAIPDDPQVSLDRRFFPKSKLRDLLTSSQIQEVLACSCHYCQIRIEIAPKLDISESSSRILKSSLLVFALLLYIKCPQLIHSFLARGFDDTKLNSQPPPSEEDLRTQYWHNFNEEHPKVSQRLAQEFKWRIYKFAIPYMTDDELEYTTYHENTLFPFFDEKPIEQRDKDGNIRQEGAFGHVFSFKIHEYNCFQVSSTIILSD